MPRESQIWDFGFVDDAVTVHLTDPTDVGVQIPDEHESFDFAVDQSFPIHVKDDI